MVSVLEIKERILEARVKDAILSTLFDQSRALEALTNPSDIVKGTANFISYIRNLYMKNQNDLGHLYETLYEETQPERLKEYREFQRLQSELSSDSSFAEKENLVACILQHCRHMGDILAYAERYTGGQIIDRMECAGSNQKTI